MENTEHNQEDMQHRDQNTPQAQEHETHVTAVVLLVLLTVAIVAVIFWFGSQPDTGSNETQPVNPVASTSGWIVPISQAQTQQSEGMSGFPPSLSLPDNAEVIKNYSTQLSGNRTQRIVIFDTESAPGALVSKYEAWAKSNNFTINRSQLSSDDAVVTAEAESVKMTMVVSSNEGSNRVQINFVIG